MKTFTISNLKGGVAKSTSTVNTAYSFSLLGKRVLVIDLDPQCNTTRFFAKVNKSGCTIQDVLADASKIKKAVRRTQYRDIDIVRGCPELNEDWDTGRLEAALELIKDRYDVCVIDTRPSFEALTMNAAMASDVLLTPVKFDNFSRDNLALVEDFYEEMRRYKDGLEWKVFAVMAANTRAQRKASADLLKKHDYPVMDTCISRTADVDNALSFYKPVMRHRRKSTAASDYMELARELLG